MAFCPGISRSDAPRGSTRSLLWPKSAGAVARGMRSDMRTILALVVVLYSGAALAQATAPAASSPPPTVGGKPLVQVKPRGSAPKATPAKGEHLSIAKRLLACQDIDDGTKGRLD